MKSYILHRKKIRFVLFLSGVLFAMIGSGYWVEMFKINAVVQAEEKPYGYPYAYNDDGTITDKRTGLMWTAFDSHFVKGACLTYHTAVNFTAELKYGGYSDWRLPSVDEIRYIYTIPPTFPSCTKAKWYWTSGSLLRQKGMPTMTSVVFVDNGKTGMIETSRGCGAVRAVRNP